ncbi:hypothetical protein BCR34DRAFT_80554 [Clohesyomyces aquaticus]|uniref:Uncharacterized protein n=1 Tax=Clohesyomyces aquaticus TaxID=1231657 RepID=A0A1Y1YXE7_9PLEO|nr:hypothetical protein BCR34DRAFT_80554 [Clohesyomyces aquaticus]
MVSAKILLFSLPILSTYAMTSMCSWKEHCVGHKCSNHDDCSDTLACKEGECQVDSAPVDPFTISLLTWNRQYCTFAPEGCRHNCPHSCFSFTDLLIEGEHFNIGTENVQVEVRNKQGDQLIWSTTGNAVKTAGKTRGSFRIQAPLGASFSLSGQNAYVKVRDIESDQWSEPEFFAYRNDGDQ